MGAENKLRVHDKVLEKIEKEFQLFVYKKCPINKNFLFLIQF